MLMRPATKADHRPMAVLSAAIFIDDPIDAYLYPNRREYPKRFVGAQLSLIHSNLSGPDSEAVVIVLEPGDEGWKGSPDIVGFCIFEREDKSNKPFRTRVRESFVTMKTSFVESRLVELCSDLTNPLVNFANARATNKAAKKKDAVRYVEGFEKPDDQYEVYNFGVHPDFQRRGIAKRMMQLVFDKAEKDGVPVYLASSPSGDAFYRAMGFCTVGKWYWCPVPDTEWEIMHWTPPKHKNDGLQEERGGEGS